MKKIKMDKHGFTLVEVMAAAVILLIAVEILMTGIHFAVRTRKRTEEIRMAGYAVEEKLTDGDECTYGTISLDFGEDLGEICMDGELYQKEVDENFSAAFIWADEIMIQELSVIDESDSPEEEE